MMLHTGNSQGSVTALIHILICYSLLTFIIQVALILPFCFLLATIFFIETSILYNSLKIQIKVMESGTTSFFCDIYADDNYLFNLMFRF